eukprot:192132_1
MHFANRYIRAGVPLHFYSFDLLRNIISITSRDFFICNLVSDCNVQSASSSLFISCSSALDASLFCKRCCTHNVQFVDSIANTQCSVFISDPPSIVFISVHLQKNQMSSTMLW